MSVWVCITNNIVVDTFVPSSDPNFLADHVAPNYDQVVTVPDGTYVGIGFTYNGGVSFTYGPAPLPQETDV